MAKTCKIEGCEQKHKAHGLCKSHYRKLLRKNRTITKVCRVEGCTKLRSFESTLCGMHRKRLLTHGDPHKSLWHQPRPTCSVVGCPKQSVSHKNPLCIKHETRRLRYGDPHYSKLNRDPNKPNCLVSGCSGKYSGNGYCGIHAHRYRRYGSPLAGGPRKNRTDAVCAAEGCNLKRNSLDFCQKHYKTHTQTGRACVAAYKKRRLERLKLAIPKALKPYIEADLSDFYRACPPQFQVDHIVPLLGKNVSGLHVPWNLQYLDRKANQQKGNKF